jgi:hypothetical protein
MRVGTTYFLQHLCDIISQLSRYVMPFPFHKLPNNLYTHYDIIIPSGIYEGPLEIFKFI